MMSDTFDSQLSQLISMGYDPVVSRNALEAADGNVEVAIEIIEHDQTGEAASKTKAEQVLDQWGQQLLGDKHPQVKQKAIEAGATAKSAWTTALGKLQQVDQQYNITSTMKDAIKSGSETLKDLDQKHDISGKANKAANEAGAAISRTVETAKKSFS